MKTVSGSGVRKPVTGVSLSKKKRIMKVKDYQRAPLVNDMRIGIAWIIILVFGFAFYLIHVPSGIGFTISAFLALVLFISPCILLANPTLVKVLRKDIEAHPIHVWILPSFLFLVFLLYAFITGHAGGPGIFKGFLYCFIPFLLVLPLKNSSPVLTIPDVILVLFLWLPVEFGIVPGLGIPHVQPIVSVYLLIGLNILLYIYLVIRQLPGMGYTFKLKDHEWRTAVMNFLVLLVISILAGLVTHFIVFSRSMPSFGEMIQKLLFICFFVALPEEILFRGVVLNLIETRLGGIKNAGMVALVISSVLYGLAHGNNAIPPFVDMNAGFLGTWHIPWAFMLLATIAGFFYGLTFIKTRKVFAAVIVHLFINWSWFVFFSG